MQLLLLHWHCILPAAAILTSMVLMGRDKKTQDKGSADEIKTQDSLEDKELRR